MSDSKETMPESGAESTPEPLAERGILWDDSLPGQPLTSLLFHCSEHGEEVIVEYYDPDDPPRCSRGDLMSRKAG